MIWRKNLPIDTLIGKSITKIDVAEKHGDSITFTCLNGDRYRMDHNNDCCESVDIEDVNGDWDDLLNTPILLATEESNQDNPKANHDTDYLWTFYTLGTIKGTVKIRWYGESNGYYSIEVEFYKLEADE